MFNALKGMLFEEEAGKDGAVVPPKAPAQTTTQPQQPVGTAAMAHYASPALNTAMVEAIRKATFGRNTALTNLIAQAENFADVIPDPVMRMKAAHKASGGRSAKEITDAIAIHLQDVDGEVMRFGQALNGKKATELGSLTAQANATEQSITGAQAEIQSLSNRIAQLQQGIADNTTKLAQLRGELQTKDSEFQRAEQEFAGAAEAVRQELNGHRASITSTIG